MNRKKQGKLSTNLRLIGVHMGVFAAVLLGLYLLMVLSAAIPNDAIRKNMADSARYELTVDRYAIADDGNLQQMADNYADQIWLNIAWQLGNGNPFVSALDTGYYDFGSFGAAASLHQTVTRGYTANKSYIRYWHGGAACLRILHLWTDIQGAKSLGLLCVLFLILITAFELLREKRTLMALCLLLSLMAVQVWQVRLSFEYIPGFLICFGLCPAFLLLEKRGDTHLTLLCVTAGTLTAFFDFLTVETITVLLPLILVMAVRSMDGRLGDKKALAVLICKCLLCWGCAYGGAFLVKWMTAALVTGENQILAALSSAERRVGETVLVNGVETKPGLLLAIGANLAVLFGGDSRTSYGKMVLGLLICGIILFALVRNLRTGRPAATGTYWILGLGALVFVRYGVLANHSYLHAFFTYRALVSPILAILTALVLNLRLPGRERLKI